DEVKGKEKKNGTNYDQTKSGERPGERKNESITGNNERQARTGSTILRDEETDRADELAMEMNKEEGKEGRHTPEDLPKREETEERHIDDEKRRIDEGSRGKVDKSTGREEYSDRSRERTSVRGDDKLKQGITTNATEQEDKEMKQEINEALGYNANKGLNNEMSQRASEELNGNVHGEVNDEVNKRTRDKMNEPDEAPYDPRVELSNNASRTPKNRTELLNERNDRIEQPMDVRRSSSSSEQSLRTVNKAFGTVNEPRGLSNGHNSALKTKELRENSWEHKSDEEHTNEMNASEMGREGIVLKNGTACVGNSNVEVSRSVHSSGETSEIRLAGGEGSDMAQLTRQVKHDESDKSITLDELSKAGIALPEDVGPNDMLNLIKFLFTNTTLQEKKNNVHALHILLMLSINSDIFEEGRLNEVVRILLDLINFQEALMYAVNYSNLLVSTPAPGEDSTGEMEHNSSGQSIDTCASNVEAVDAMIESKLDNFYFSNGKPVKYIALERINLTNDTLLIVVKHFNPFHHEFWMSYVEQKDLREVFFILRHVLKSSALERCKRTLFVRLFYGYDEKLFMAYELIYERGFEELLIEEVQMNKSRRIDYDRDVVEEEVVGEGNETEGNIGKGMERNFRSGIGGSVGGDIENEVQGEKRRNIGDRTGRDIENEKRTGDEKRYGEDKTNQSSGISRKENDKSTVIVDQRNKHGNKCEQICLKILKYSFNVLNTFTFYKTLNIISNRPIIPFFSSLSSSALFNKIIDDRNIVLMHKMLQYNHKFVKHLRRGVNLFDVIFNARAVRTYAQLPKTSEEYVLVISIVKYLLRLNLVPSINYSAIYARAPLSFFYDTLELVEHVLADKNAYPFFLESVPRNNIVFKIKNREFLKDFYLTVVNEYYGVCVDCLRVDGAVGDASRTWCDGTAGVKDGNGRENNKGDENGRDDGNTVGIKNRNETGSNRVTRTVEQIDLVFLLDVIKRVNKRKHEFDMGTITERVLFILSVVYRRHGAYSTNKEIIVDTIYDLRDEEELPEKDSFTFQTVMNSILDIIIGESTFINAYIKYFSTRLPLNEKLNRRIFLLVLQSNKYAYLNRVFAPNGPVLKNAVDLSKLIDIGTITETEKLAINNVFLERLKISGTSYFNLFFNDYIANQKKIENVSHLYFLMSNMNKKASTHRLIEMCLQYLCKAVQSKKKIGSNLMRVCLRGCGVPLSDRSRGYVCSIAYFLIKREQEVNLEVEGYNERYEHVMLVHQGGDRGRKEAMSKNESRENDNSRGASSIRNDCTSCNSGQSIGLDTLIYHNIGIKEYFEYFLESATFFKGTKCSLIKKSILLQQIDADRIQELFSRLNSNFFTGKEADSLNKASVLKRISFFILSLDFEAFSAHLPAIIPIINELIEYPKPVKREIYNLISVIFIKFHHNNLSALFPIYFSEIENDSLLESIRSLEMLMLIGSKETVEFRWYISCTKDDNTLFKRMLNELYRGTEVRPYLDRLPATRMPLLMNDKKAFLSRAESYYEMLDESVWSIDEGLLSSRMIEWYVGGV
ncbi:hypothetical protein VCUG_00473, partial [Vavraia culicis subsp. floridensis]